MWYFLEEGSMYALHFIFTSENKVSSTLKASVTTKETEKQGEAIKKTVSLFTAFISPSILNSHN